MVVSTSEASAHAARHGERITQTKQGNIMPLMNEDRSCRWVATFTGQQFKLPDPEPDSIQLVDIAHALSLTARFAGHTSRCSQVWCKDHPVLLSVAEHCVRVAEFLELHCNNETVMAGLLHDASEAYIGDMPAPFKALLPDYMALEDNLQMAIYKKFGIDWSQVDAKMLHYADGLDCFVEARQFMTGPIDTWTSYADFSEDLQWMEPIKPMDARDAKELFLTKAHEIGLDYG